MIEPDRMTGPVMVHDDAAGLAMVADLRGDLDIKRETARRR